MGESAGRSFAFFLLLFLHFAAKYHRLLMKINFSQRPINEGGLGRQLVAHTLNLSITLQAVAV